ncbi:MULTISPECIES: Fic family protein [unclassified Streptomyces]|uniref:Fic family protein n=1 Tax=unclassified Streptomyces TaxID=2593676 RepID=UPI0033AF85A0
MIHVLSARHLDWDDVEPVRHPFDRASVEQVVRSLGPARNVPRRPDVPFADPVMTAWDREVAEPWADAMSQALVERYGRWTVGWRWSHDEGDFDGGPVGHWCCPRDSVTTPEETLPRVVAALCEWRDWLESLAGRFEAYPLDLADVEDQRILWECAARNLIIQVTDRTGCGSGWHGHCHQVLAWFLDHWGIAPDTAQVLVERAVGGRFRSWTGPDRRLVDDIAERLARSLRPDDAEPDGGPLPDHLRRWLTVRESVPWPEAGDTEEAGAVEPARDGAAEDIRLFDGALDPARAEGLLTALHLLRADAARGARPDFDLLRGWQRHVLGTPGPPEFRTLPAFAKEGRERYGIDADTRERFDACLAESAMEGPLPLAARAARAYLDVCFFHPFDDGNARSAFLTLVFVLAREGVALDDVKVLRRLAFQAEAPQDAVTLARFIDMAVTGTRNRALSSSR